MFSNLIERTMNNAVSKLDGGVKARPPQSQAPDTA